MTKCYRKGCKKCGSYNTKKDGKRKGKQSYKCKSCGYVWVNKSRKKQKHYDQLYKDYAIHKQTYAELAEKYGCSKRATQRQLDEHEIYKSRRVILQPREIILLIDTTYFDNFGLMVFRDKENKQTLYHMIVDYENNTAYKQGILHLQQQGWIIQAIVCDGRRGLLGGFGDIPTQLCHFHQKATIRKYITKKPKLQANKDLKAIVDWLHRTDKYSFTLWLDEWHKKYKSFIDEQGINNQGKDTIFIEEQDLPTIHGKGTGNTYLYMKIIEGR